MITNILTFIKGKKTFFIAFCGIVYGISQGSIEIVLASLTIAGFRDAMK